MFSKTCFTSNKSPLTIVCQMILTLQLFSDSVSPAFLIRVGAAMEYSGSGEEEDEEEANEINDDPQALGSEISATTVEIVFGTTRTPDTTMMSTEEENQTEEDYENVVETTEPPEAESRVVEMDFLKKMAKQALQRKYKKVKKPKQLIEEK